MANLALKLEALDGARIDQTAAEVCVLARNLGVAVELTFNRVRLMVRPGAEPARVVETYNVGNRAAR